MGPVLNTFSALVTASCLALPVGLAQATPAPFEPTDPLVEASEQSVAPAAHVAEASAKPVTAGRKCRRTPTRPALGFPRGESPPEPAAAGRAGKRLVRTWSYVGPRAALSRARVTVKDRTGCVVAKGRSTRTGTFTAQFREGRLPRMPLTVTTRQGRVSGVRFTGSMRARIYTIGERAPIAQVGLVSTAASRVAEKRRGYTKATKQVRRTLGIRRGSLPDSLRYRNSDVGYRQLARKIRSTGGGFDGFAAKVARKAEAGKVMSGLEPSSATASGPRRRAKASGLVTASAAPETSVCQAPLPTNGSTSDQVISDIAAIGVGGLLEYAGVPVTSADGITGMLLSPLGDGSETTVLQQDVQAVMSELTCISEQINYLSAQIAELQFTVDVDTATTCANAVTTGYNDYAYLVNNASQYPITASNSSLQSYLPLWNELNETCGDGINSMLFGTAGGQGSAWQQLNQNYSAGVQWYTQEQVQGLQTFLSYWGTILYQQFILTNEYYNYYGDWESAQANAGGSNPNGASPVCSAGAGPETPTYCVWQNSIAAAYPDDLFSDEIGIIASGMGVNANPGGMIAQNPIFMSESQTESIYLKDTDATANESYTPTAMNASWWYNYYLNFVEYSPSQYSGSPPVTFNTNGVVDCGFPGYPQGCFPSGAPTSTWNWPIASANQFNAQGVNPKGYGSAVQTFWNPQSTDRQAVTWSQVSALGSAGPGGTTATDVFYKAMNQTPSPYPSGYAADGAWSALNSSQGTYWTNDTSSSITLEIATAVYDYYSTMTQKAPLGQTSGYSYTNPSNNNVYPAEPYYAYLTGRTWWPEAADATSFQPPQPPTS